MPDGGADRQRTRPQQFGLLLDEGPCLREQVVDLVGSEVKGTVDQILTELLDRLDGAGLDRRPLLCDLPDGKPQQAGDDRCSAEDRDGDREPPRETQAKHPGKRRPYQCREQNRDQQRDDQQLELYHEPDSDPDRCRDHQEPPRVRGGQMQPGRNAARRLNRHDPSPVPDRVEERPRGLVVGRAHPFSLELAHAASRMRWR